MTDAPRNEALEKLNRGIEDSRRRVQQQAMKFAQEYFDDSVEELRQQVRDRRAALENLPDQIPGGSEESFQASFGQLMEKYSGLEDCLAEARDNGDIPSVELSKRQEEVNATDAARRKAGELGIDLTQVEGTGSGGRIVIWDVTELAEGEEPADQSGQERSDQAAQDTAGREVDQAQQTADGAVQGTQEAVGQATQQAQDAVGQVSGQARHGVNQVTEQVGQITRQTQETTGQAAGQAQEVPGEPKATSAAWRKAEEMGIDLTQVEGTGAEGLITLEDVMGS